MINLNFGLFWSGSKLSYLRYMTFKTLRFFHPDSKIQLYRALNFKKDTHSWNREKQEFENPNIIKQDYTDKLQALDVEIIDFDFCPQYSPNYQSDFFRYWFLNKFGGFYLDTDQIILRSFEDLPLDCDFMHCSYNGYHPVGVLGSEIASNAVNKIIIDLPNHYDPNDYNSLGPWMLRDILSELDLSRAYNAPQQYFYPVPISDLTMQIYNGSFNIPDISFAMHWFGGHPISQKFNEKYTEKFAKQSNDSISKFLRNKDLL